MHMVPGRLGLVGKLECAMGGDETRLVPRLVPSNYHRHGSFSTSETRYHAISLLRISTRLLNNQDPEPVPHLIWTHKEDYQVPEQSAERTLDQLDHLERMEDFVFVPRSIGVVSQHQVNLTDPKPCPKDHQEYQLPGTSIGKYGQKAIWSAVPARSICLIE
ncbi:hypothetical protein BJ508DRAFT_335177 [Ascobolus immersus RN42]|uniref:Uncharacterized protein n=1 Tax=Ascobolus immersus RN42 TaxID=1160509 RepID=A0A3N4HGT2_ASCIM|nr:hypothetical protein BJ508DRAFT_335177 [Ascobolus immersus RN42]